VIKRIKIKNFTLISEETIEFSDGLNIVIGENSVGKSHILKLAYALVRVSYEAATSNIKPNKKLLERMIGEKLINVFKPDTLGRLVQRAVGRKKCEIEIIFKNNQCNFSFSFSTASKTDVTITKMSDLCTMDAPLFFPTREVISIFPGFTSLYRDRHIEFDETYYDLCLALEATILKGPRLNNVRLLIDPLEEIIGGQVKIENGRFYLAIPGKGNMEVSLVAEGLRKIAMLAYLITNGSLKDKGMIFWDEPETNLNPKIIKLIAKTLIKLTESGIQVFIATHSLFLLRELEILNNDNVNQQYIGLNRVDDIVQLSQGKSIDDIDSIVSLDESLAQTDRFLNE